MTDARNVTTTNWFNIAIRSAARARLKYRAWARSVTTMLAYNNASQFFNETYAGGALNGLAVANAYDAHLRLSALALNTQTATLPESECRAPPRPVDQPCQKLNDSEIGAPKLWFMAGTRVQCWRSELPGNLPLVADVRRRTF
ncbi:MAG: hypothetical protein IH623_27160 [Verrucomicrobia bacterium]|nr:hypothetical protein [Verrucomicrobiota bacterium]